MTNTLPQIRQELMREFLEYTARHLTEEISYQWYLERALFHALGGLDDDARQAVLDGMPIAEQCLITLPTK